MIPILMSITLRGYNMENMKDCNTYISEYRKNDNAER